jgi:hypothetical protein
VRTAPKVAHLSVGKAILQQYKAGGLKVAETIQWRYVRVNNMALPHIRIITTTIGIKLMADW